MKTKLISISIILIFLFTSIFSVEAIAPTPRVELDEYQITTTDINNIYINGTVSICVGQLVGIYDSNGIVLYNYIQLPNNNSSGSFKLQVPSRFLSKGTNIFKVKSLPINGVINGSNPKTLTVKINITKKNQTITANDLTVTLDDTKNINAKVNSNLSLSYKSNDTSIATVDYRGNVVGRKIGSTKITITQAGNNDYNATSKTINITVTKKSTPSPTPTNQNNTYTIIYNSNGGKGSMSYQKVEVGKTVNLHSNKFTREGYEFVGWAVSKDMASLPSGYKRVGVKSNFSTSSAKKYYKKVYKNINMMHFQLGKVTYKNKASVKNLTSKNKQIVLYAVWKGNGPQAAIDWGHIMANEDVFWYGQYTPGGDCCYLCGKNGHNRTGYACHSFAVACYTHGANFTKSGKCPKVPNHVWSSWKKRVVPHLRSDSQLKCLGAPPFDKLKPGDIILRKHQGNSGGHTWIYVGGDSRLESVASPKSEGKAKHIKYKTSKARSTYNKAKKQGRITVLRYVP